LDGSNLDHSQSKHALEKAVSAAGEKRKKGKRGEPFEGSLVRKKTDKKNTWGKESLPKKTEKNKLCAGSIGAGVNPSRAGQDPQTKIPEKKNKTPAQKERGGPEKKNRNLAQGSRGRIRKKKGRKAIFVKRQTLGVKRKAVVRVKLKRTWNARGNPGKKRILTLPPRREVGDLKLAF